MHKAVELRRLPEGTAGGAEDAGGSWHHAASMLCPTGAAAAVPVQPPKPSRCACLECRLGGGHLILALALLVCGREEEH